MGNKLIFDRLKWDLSKQSAYIANDINKLVTLEVLYYLPDYPSILQSFIWQLNDLYPEYPKIYSFIGFWEKQIEAKINSITIIPNSNFIVPEYRFVEAIINLE